MYNLNNTEILDLATLEWRVGPVLPGYIASSASIQYGDSFLLVGGEGDGNPDGKSILEFNPDDEVWIIREEKLPIPGPSGLFLLNSAYLKCG